MGRRRAGEVRASAQGINAEAAAGPPEGLPAKGLLLLIDPDGSGQPLRDRGGPAQGDETLNAMSPPADGMGQRTSVEMYEVAADLRM
jgi:hypothetical protein